MKKTFRHKDFTATFTDEDGHFSFTGSHDGGSGACGHRIAEDYPEFAQLENLHLCDSKTGVPMHAWANTLYRLKKGETEKAAASLHLDPTHELFLAWAENDTAETRAEIEAFWQERADNIWDYIEDELSDFFPENQPGYSSPLDEDGKILEVYSQFWDEEQLDRASALAQHLDCNIGDIEESRYDDKTLRAEGHDWLVLTDDEADSIWDEHLESYIDECIIHELPKQYRCYFDREAWKKDARTDGRGHSLSSYDGCEYCEAGEISGENYYIYKQ